MFHEFRNLSYFFFINLSSIVNSFSKFSYFISFKCLEENLVVIGKKYLFGFSSSRCISTLIANYSRPHRRLCRNYLVPFVYFLQTSGHGTEPILLFSTLTIWRAYLKMSTFRPSLEKLCSGYATILHLMMRLQLWSTLSLPLLPCPLWPRVAVPGRVPSMGQISLFSHLPRIIISYLKPYSCSQIFCLK